MPKILEAKLKSNIWKYYFYEIMDGMFFSVPIMVLFWQENGLSLSQIMILQSLYSIAAVLLEVPTGYFADVFGRKKTLALGGLFWALGIITYSLGYNFYQFLIAEMLFALGSSFKSGADSAIVYDTLVELKQEDLYKKIWGNARFLGMATMGLAGIIGAFVGKSGLRLTLYISIPFFLMQFFIALFFKEPTKHEAPSETSKIKEMFNIVKQALLKNVQLKWLIIYGAIIFAFNQSALWLYQPYFKITGLDIVYFGLVFASFQIVAAFSAKYAHRLENILGQKFSLIMLPILIGVSYLLMNNFIFLFSFSFCFLQQFVRGFSDPVISDYLNKLTPSHTRATILSIKALAGRLIYAAIIPFIGWVADIYSLTQALFILGITILIIGAAGLLMLKKVKVI
ncbi:MAG: Nitrate/nitrite transporter [Candidatus Magasanikbacteria bacterium GW2011_GWC2_37_14]|uniref:Nitrate/nitrite transporter n=1 Tax=Candidatus Magasanikbacteria bacterium GW2011_GWC2_37_14 TaxID=1619046 RepID=A0A0G0G8T0_9BACT|nr:MAG: Nitrate/nitrite transporter [Candidatus Magasanikbacteria bacterium GW2011_GWC2_37_14]